MIGSRVMYFVIKENAETICTTDKRENAEWIAANYPEACEVRKVEY